MAGLLIGIDGANNATVTGTQTLTNKTFVAPALGTVASGDISNAAIVYPSGHMLQSNYRQLTWAGDHAVSPVETWSTTANCKLEMTLKRANTKVLCYASTGDILIDDSAMMSYYFIAKVGADSLSATGNSGVTETDVLGLTRRDSGTSINGPLNMSAIMTLSNSADAIWTFAPVASSSTGNCHTNYSGTSGRGAFWIAEIG